MPDAMVPTPEPPRLVSAWREERVEREPSAWRSRLQAGVALVVGLAVLGLLGWWLFFKPSPGPPPQRQVVSTVTRVSLPPPPPPPPPKVDPPPSPLERPSLQESKPLETPRPPAPQPAARPQAAPGPPPALGLPTGPAAPNPYALGPGSGDGLIGGGGGTGGGGGGGGGRWGAYGAQAGRVLAAALQRDECTSRGRYAANIRVWIDPNGIPTRALVASSSGDPERDRCIERVTLGTRFPLPEPGMPQPMITRATGS